MNTLRFDADELLHDQQKNPRGWSWILVIAVCWVRKVWCLYGKTDCRDIGFSRKL